MREGLLALAWVSIGCLSVACANPAPMMTVPDGSPGYEVPPCEPNTAAKCVGKGGCKGGKLCGPDGTYGVCACDGDAGMAPDGETLDAPATDVAASPDGGTPDGRSPESGWDSGRNAEGLDARQDS